MQEGLSSKHLKKPDIKHPLHLKLFSVMGPGLITGAADDDPSGIATYSQVGAQFGYGIGWTLIFSYPLMCAIQEISAQIGRVTGCGLAANLRRFYPAWILNGLVSFLIIANTINIGADLGAMAAALKLLIGGPQLFYVAMFAAVSVLLEIYVSYSHYVSVLKWMTLSLFAYVAAAFVVHMPWMNVLRALALPAISLKNDYITGVVAVFGTTISPYLFFWQASSEVEKEKARPAAKPLKTAPSQAPAELRRIRMDTYIGMAFSNLIALFIVLTTAATLHAHGLTDIQTSAQAAEALRPIAGKFAYVVFALGIIGTGLLALPVLAGSAAYALSEARQWPMGLARKLHRAKAFYATIAVATVIGAVLNLTSLDPVKALFWTAVINGIVAVPIMIMMMLMAESRKVMSKFELKLPLKTIGWLATIVMALAAAGMFVTMGKG
jgi:Mn2+/Fe2+ NRAMP family transporter